MRYTIMVTDTIRSATICLHSPAQAHGSFGGFREHLRFNVLCVRLSLSIITSSRVFSVLCRNGLPRVPVGFDVFRVPGFIALHPSPLYSRSAPQSNAGRSSVWLSNSWLLFLFSVLHDHDGLAINLFGMNEIRLGCISGKYAWVGVSSEYAWGWD